MVFHIAEVSLRELRTRDPRESIRIARLARDKRKGDRIAETIRKY